MEIKTLTVDLSKNIQHVCAFDKHGNLLSKKVYKTDKFHQFLANTNSCTIIMEACGGAHHWARTAKKYGHTSKLIAPKFVKRFIEPGKKNDFEDALAIFEAATRPRARFVSIKSQEQQEIAFLHRSRSRVIKDRTQLINQMHAYVCELGYRAPKAKGRLKQFIHDLCDPSTAELSLTMKTELRLLLEELSEKDERVKDLDNTLKNIANAHAISIKLMKVRGIGFVTASALLAEVGDFSIFDSGREFAAWLGLVPRQNTTGGKVKLGSITKTGNRYLRSLLVHGGRALYSATRKKDTSDPKFAQWMQEIAKRHPAIAIVAAANKLARIVWAIIVHDREYDPNHVSVPPVFAKKAKVA